MTCFPAHISPLIFGILFLGTLAALHNKRWPNKVIKFLEMGHKN